MKVHPNPSLTLEITLCKSFGDKIIVAVFSDSVGSSVNGGKY